MPHNIFDPIDVTRDSGVHAGRFAATILSETGYSDNILHTRIFWKDYLKWATGIT